MSEQPSPVASVQSPEPSPLAAFYAAAQFPSLRIRLMALFVDLLFVLLVFSLASMVINAAGGAPDFVRGLIFILTLYLYDPLMTAYAGGTLGHHLMGLRVRRFDNPDHNISIGRAFVRFLLKSTLGFISFVTVTSSEHRRAIHDLGSNAIMLFKKK